jgi:hypothetical protein
MTRSEWRVPSDKSIELEHALWLALFALMCALLVAAKAFLPT